MVESKYFEIVPKCILESKQKSLARKQPLSYTVHLVLCAYFTHKPTGRAPVHSEIGPA